METQQTYFDNGGQEKMEETNLQIFSERRVELMFELLPSFSLHITLYQLLFTGIQAQPSWFNGN